MRALKNEQLSVLSISSICRAPVTELRLLTQFVCSHQLLSTNFINNVVMVQNDNLRIHEFTNRIYEFTDSNLRILEFQEFEFFHENVQTHGSTTLHKNKKNLDNEFHTWQQNYLIRRC